MNEDAILQQRVIDELQFDPSIAAAHIGVSVRDGVVALSGHVDSFVEKAAAERAARRVKGVKAVAQEIEVRLPGDKKTDDDEIAARAVKLLEWDVAVPHAAIQVKVTHGIVTLNGTVDWAYQSAEAEYDVRKLSGVKAVINDLRIRPQANVADVRAQIRGAFERSAELDASRVAVDVVNGKIVLSGKVRSWTERQDAERAAWSAPGVTAVENRIEIV
ncbi:MAG TPA: BON domain-containing protein [Stellaceae bacterium]|nr:BON domain-containing protein [Stellaceae bacterium]